MLTPCGKVICMNDLLLNYDRPSMPNLKRILIVEDNVDDETLLRRQLKKAGLEKQIDVFHDGGKALEYLSNSRFQCEELAAVFLDLCLPTIHGLKILEAIRSSERLKHLPVIIMTSSNSPEELNRCKELGVLSCVGKPLTLASFSKAFADCFHVRRTTAEPAPLTFAS